jgi:hypothetical protein
MKSVNALRSRREATRIEWTPSGSFHCNATPLNLRISSNRFIKLILIPAGAGLSLSRFAD